MKRKRERDVVELKLWRSLCSPEKVPQDARVGDRRERERERERAVLTVRTITQDELKATEKRSKET